MPVRSSAEVPDDAHDVREAGLVSAVAHRGGPDQREHQHDCSDDNDYLNPLAGAGLHCFFVSGCGRADVGPASVSGFLLCAVGWAYGAMRQVRGCGRLRMMGCGLGGR